jgi:hypothetical protein
VFSHGNARAFVLFNYYKLYITSIQNLRHFWIGGSNYYSRLFLIHYPHENVYRSVLTFFKSCHFTIELLRIRASPSLSRPLLYSTALSILMHYCVGTMFPHDSRVLKHGTRHIVLLSQTKYKDILTPPQNINYRMTHPFYQEPPKGDQVGVAS